MFVVTLRVYMFTYLKCNVIFLLQTLIMSSCTEDKKETHHESNIKTAFLGGTNIKRGQNRHEKIITDDITQT